MKDKLIYLICCLCIVAFIVSLSELFDILCVVVLSLTLFIGGFSFSGWAKGVGVVGGVLVFVFALIAHNCLVEKTESYVASITSTMECLKFEDLLKRDGHWEYMDDISAYAIYINYYGFTRRVILWSNGAVRYDLMYEPSREAKVWVCK